MDFKYLKTGCTRMVFLIGNFAIKIAKPRIHKHFLQGCYANWSEREYYKTHIRADYKNNMVHYVAPSLFCSWFGLIQIQKRCILNHIILTDDEKKFFEVLSGTDNKPTNFGWYNGKLVCLDYP